jgi:hypothetical protein
MGTVAAAPAVAASTSTERASSGDAPAAIALLKALAAGASASGTAKDAELIAKAFEVGIINQPERIQLEAMRDLRNQYSHPTALAPSHASAAHALHTAVTTVLAKQALIMHGAAKDLAMRASTDRHLVPQDQTAIDAFTHSRAVVIHYDARPIFIRELLVGAD